MPPRSSPIAASFSCFSHPPPLCFSCWCPCTPAPAPAPASGHDFPLASPSLSIRRLTIPDTGHTPTAAPHQGRIPATANRPCCTGHISYPSFTALPRRRSSPRLVAPPPSQTGACIVVYYSKLQYCTELYYHLPVAFRLFYPTSSYRRSPSSPCSRHPIPQWPALPHHGRRPCRRPLSHRPSGP